MENVILIPNSAEVHVNVIFESFTSEALVFSYDFVSGFLGTFAVDVELWGGFYFKFVVIAATTIASAVLGYLPKVVLLLSEAAVAVAPTVDLDVDASSWLMTESISLSDKHIHKVIITVFGVALGHHILRSFLLLDDVYSHISILLLNKCLRFLLLF